MLKSLDDIYDLDLIKKYKKLAIKEQTYEKAASIRERELYLMSDDGKLAIIEHNKKIIRERRSKIINRLNEHF